MESAKMQVETERAMATKEAFRYENRQVTLTSIAAAGAVGSVTPAAPVATPVSMIAGGLAILDKLVTTGELSYADAFITVMPVFHLAEVAGALTEVAEVASTVKTGEAALDIGASTMGAGAAVLEKQQQDHAPSTGGANKPKDGSGKSPKPPMHTGSHIPGVGF